MAERDGFEATVRDARAGAGDAVVLAIVPDDTYEILGELARGGLGRIVRARDRRTGRVVAIKEALDDDDEAAARFVREAIVSANLQHPAIVPVYEVARWAHGRPFFAMKLVAGRSLADVVAARDTPETRLALVPHVVAVADALAYAHGQGWIHRDLKPHNVLVGDHGETVVIDWGLARRTDDRTPLAPGGPRAAELAGPATLTGAVMGTPAYMPPEQAQGEVVDERADVYAIGAMLYHVLAGAMPYGDSGAPNQGAVLARVIDAPPTPLAAIAPHAPADLVAIVLRAMARAPGDRYPSAAELAADLRRFTTGQLVRAHRYRVGERVRRFVRRHRGALAIAAIGVVVLATYGAWSIDRIVRERDHARAEQRATELARAEAARDRDRATAHLAALYVDRASAELRGGHANRALPLAAAAMRAGADDPALRFLAARALADVDGVRAFIPATDVTTMMFVDHDLVYATPTELVRWDPEAGRARWRVAIPGIEILDLADGAIVAMRGATGVILDGDTGAVRRELDVPRTAAAWTAPEAARSADGRLIALAFEHGEVVVWELATGRVLAELATGMVSPFVRFTGDGRGLVLGASASELAVWDLATGARGPAICPADDGCRPLGGTRALALATPTNVVRGGRLVGLDGRGRVAWEAPVAAPVADTVVVEASVFVLRADGLGERRALADGRVLWTTRALSSSSTGDLVAALQYADHRLVAVGVDGEIAILESSQGASLAHFASDVDAGDHAVSSDGTRGAVAFAGGIVIRALDRAELAPLARHQAGVRIAALATRGASPVAIVGLDSGDVAIDTIDGATTPVSGHGARVHALATHGDELISGGEDGEVCRSALATGVRRACWHAAAGVSAMALAPDGARLAVAGADGSVTVHALADGARGQRWTMPHPSSVLVWGDRLVAGDEHAGIHVWDPDTGAVIRELEGGQEIQGRSSLAVSPDRAWAIAAGQTPTLRSLTGAADRPLAGAASGPAFVVAFDPRGRRVLHAAADRRLRVWDVASGRLELTTDAGGLVTAAVFSPDGALVIGGTSDGAVMAWSVATGAMLARTQVPGIIRQIELSADGRELLITGDAPRVYAWHLPRFDGDVATLDAAIRCRGTWRLDGDALVPQLPAPASCPPAGR